MYLKRELCSSLEPYNRSNDLVGLGLHCREGCSLKNVKLWFPKLYIKNQMSHYQNMLPCCVVTCFHGGVYISIIELPLCQQKEVICFCTSPGIVHNTVICRACILLQKSSQRCRSLVRKLHHKLITTGEIKCQFQLKLTAHSFVGQNNDMLWWRHGYLRPQMFQTPAGLLPPRLYSFVLLIRWCPKRKKIFLLDKAQFCWSFSGGEISKAHNNHSGKSPLTSSLWLCFAVRSSSAHGYFLPTVLLVHRASSPSGVWFSSWPHHQLSVGIKK